MDRGQKKVGTQSDGGVLVYSRECVELPDGTKGPRVLHGTLRGQYPRTQPATYRNVRLNYSISDAKLAQLFELAAGETGAHHADMGLNMDARLSNPKPRVFWNSQLDFGLVTH